jgi:menaquinone-dependent protoporphyrinogen oxidase
VAGFLRERRAELSLLPCAFFSVSNTAAHDPEGARRYVDLLLRDTAFRPLRIGIFAGGLAYTHYGWLTRRVMVSISRREGNPTDTSRDHEMTDWGAVDAYARELAEMFLGAERPIHP